MKHILLWTKMRTALHLSALYNVRLNYLNVTNVKHLHNPVNVITYWGLMVMEFQILFKL